MTKIIFTREKNGTLIEMKKTRLHVASSFYLDMDKTSIKILETPISIDLRGS